MVEVARYFTEFLAEEVLRQVRPLPRGQPADAGRSSTESPPARARSRNLDRLESLGDDSSRARSASPAADAPNPVLSTLRYYRDEYEAHVRERRCPAGVCRALIKYVIDEDACTGCHVCFGACPTQAISGERKQLHVIDQKLCIKCDTCRQVCKFDAIPVVDAQPALVEGRQQ